MQGKTLLTKFFFRMRKLIPLLILVFVALNPVFGQLGGKYVYTFLELPYSARAAALGGKTAPIFDKDLSLAINNPSLLNNQMNGRLNLDYTHFLAGINYGAAAYAYKFSHGYNLMGHIRYVGYGDFIKADEFGNKLGQFSAGEYAIGLSGSKKITDHWYAGVSAQLVLSQFETYHSSGLSTDYAVTYHDSAHKLTASLLVNNLGFQMTTYSGSNEPLPLNVQIGVAKKPAHMPLRFVVVAHHLTQLDFTYQDPKQNIIQTFDNLNNPVEQKIPFSEKLFRHFIFGGELVLSENFHIRFGYNHQRRKEMQIPGRPGMVGYSWGFGLRVSKFYLSYGNDFYHVAGGTNHFTLTVNPSDIFKKSNTPKDEI